ncbi:MAG: PAS domain-containing protein [Geminicoccales bacterium]
MGASSANLFREGSKPGSALILASTEVDENAIQEYHEHYHKFDSWLEESLKYESGSVLIGSEIVPDEIFVKSEWYNDFLRQLDIGRLITGRMQGDPSKADSISFYRPLRKAEFDDRARQIVAQIVPHVTSACMVYHHLLDIELRLAVTESAFDALPVGIMLIDCAGRVVHANRRAWQMVDDSDGLDVRQRQLVASVIVEQRRLDRLVRSIAVTPKGQASGSGGMLTLSRPSLKRPYSVFVAPITDIGSEQPGIFAQIRPSAVVIIHDPERATRFPIDLLRERYGLTQAEARLAAELAVGASLQTAAERFGVTKGTVRSQLKQILNKTEVKRQAELVRLLATDIAGLSADMSRSFR